MNPNLDFIGIGLGPFNLSLACLAEPIRDLRGLFLERKDGFDWHPGMLIKGTTLQNPFLADLVSLADPRSKFSFLNYCKQEGKLFTYYVRENYYLSRAEYNRYCQWAARQLPNLACASRVERVHYDETNRRYVVSGHHTHTRTPFEHSAPRLVLGLGSVPKLPACCAASAPYCIHSSAYLEHKAELQRKRSITVIGSGQSAAEVFHDLLKSRDGHGYALNWITRAPRFFPMETTKFALELITPDYIDYLSALPESVRDTIVSQQDGLYKGINATLLNEIYDLIDERRNQGDHSARLITNCELTGCIYDSQAEGYELHFRQCDQDRHFMHLTDGAVFATGYQPYVPPFLDEVRHRIRWDSQGRYRLSRDYAIDRNGSEIFVQNAGVHCHGLTSPDLGVSCHRNATILRAITGIDHYRIDRGITLQNFSMPVGDTFFETFGEELRV